MLRLKDTSKAVLAFCGYVFLLAAFALVLFALCFGRLPPDEIVVSLVFATLSFAATMTLPLIIVRDSGYRLSCTSGKRVKDNLNHELSEIG